MIGRRTSTLSRYPVVCRRDIVPSQEAASASSGHRIGIAIAVGLAVRVRGPSRCLRLDRKVVAVVRNVVVRQHATWRKCGRDVIRTIRYRLACRTAVGGHHIVTVNEPAATADGQRSRI